jgi:tRNA threonylcarbamoyl adenosine modification protein YeaZ
VTDPSSALPVLAIELSQRTGGVAFLGADGILHEVVIEGGRRDRDELAPAVARVLSDAGSTPDAISTVAVDVGPGGFTGLRISVALAQAIAEVVGARVVAVPGAVVAAASTLELSSMTGCVLVLSAAKAGTAWGTMLERSKVDAGWRIAATPGILAQPPAEPLVAVLADEHLDEAFRDAVAPKVPILEPRFSAGALARIVASGGWGLVGHDDAARGQPLNHREPEAVRIWRERHPDNLQRGSVLRPG